MARLTADQRRTQILEVATALFARSGYDATTTAAIALAAGVSEPILYRHFKGKQELFIAIVRAMSVHTLSHWKGLMEGVTDPAEQIRRIASEYPRHMKDCADAYRVLHGALLGSRDRRVLAELRAHYTQVEKFFAQIIAAGQRQGRFRRVPPKVAAWNMINGGIGFTIVGLNLQLGLSDADSLAASIEFTLRGLYADPTPNRSRRPSPRPPKVRDESI